MSDNEKRSGSTGVGFCGLLTIVFIATFSFILSTINIISSARTSSLISSAFQLMISVILSLPLLIYFLYLLFRSSISSAYTAI